MKIFTLTGIITLVISMIPLDSFAQRKFKRSGTTLSPGQTKTITHFGMCLRFQNNSSKYKTTIKKPEKREDWQKRLDGSNAKLTITRCN